MKIPAIPISRWAINDQGDVFRVSGNVGIGTSSPSSSLGVVGDGYFSGTIDAYGGFNIYNENSSINPVSVDTDGYMTDVQRVTFRDEVDNGNRGGAYALDWNNGQKQRITLDGYLTMSFIDPPGVGNFLLKIIQDGIGGKTITWPATVKWPSSIAPTLSTGVNNIDIVTFYFDGTNYYGVASLDFG